MRTLLTLALTLIGSGLAAQAPIHGGPMAGVSIADWHGSDVQGTSSITGFTAGVFLRIDQSRIFSVEPQLLYVRKGSKLDLGGGDAVKLKEDFIQIPVLLKLSVPTADRAIAPNFFAGPALAFKAGCKVRGETPGASAEESCSTAGVAVKSTDFSVIFGVGLDVRRLAFQARYDVGLTRLGDSGSANDVKTQAFLFTIGYSF